MLDLIIFDKENKVWKPYGEVENEKAATKLLEKQPDDYFVETKYGQLLNGKKYCPDCGIWEWLEYFRVDHGKPRPRCKNCEIDRRNPDKPYWERSTINDEHAEKLYVCVFGNIGAENRRYEGEKTYHGLIDIYMMVKDRLGVSKFISRFQEPKDRMVPYTMLRAWKHQCGMCRNVSLKPLIAPIESYRTYPKFDVANHMLICDDCQVGFDVVNALPPDDVARLAPLGKEVEEFHWQVVRSMYEDDRLKKPIPGRISAWQFYCPYHHWFI